jgi:hypothetical protein
MRAKRSRAALSLGVALGLFAALPLSTQGVQGHPNRTDIGAGTGSSSEWTAQPPLQLARTGLGVATVDGKILAIGGFDFCCVEDFASVEGRSLTGSGAWGALAPMTNARANVATTTVRGLAYAVGGFHGEDTLNVVETFDPASGLWSNILPLPQPRGAAGAASLGGLLYVAGGYIPLTGHRFEIARSMVVYDPVRNTWNSVAPMPTARWRLRLVASGPYLYAIGGEDPTGTSVTTVERYDPRSDSWRTMNPMHERRHVPCAVETKVGERRVLVVVGGAQRSDGVFVGGRRTTEVFDPATGQWTLLDVLLPIERASHDCAVQPDGTVLAIGGASGPAGGFVSLANVDALFINPSELR